MKERSILNESSSESLRIVRLAEASDEALQLLQEYYEAVHVIQRDKPGIIQRIIDAPASGIWVAWLGKELVGCVMLRKLDHIPNASECKRLYVKPTARGNRIADKLLDAQAEYDRSQGVE